MEDRKKEYDKVVNKCLGSLAKIERIFDDKHLSGREEGRAGDKFW